MRAVVATLMGALLCALTGILAAAAPTIPAPFLVIDATAVIIGGLWLWTFVS